MGFFKVEGASNSCMESSGPDFHLIRVGGKLKF